VVREKSIAKKSNYRQTEDSKTENQYLEEKIMIRKYASICAMVLFIGMIGKVGAEEAKKDIPISYEMPVFVSDKEPQKPGTHLNAPGDTYSYTFIIDDKYSSDPNLYIKNAILGVHITR
jgi:hypothetical protein